MAITHADADPWTDLEKKWQCIELHASCGEKFELAFLTAEHRVVYQTWVEGAPAVSSGTCASLHSWTTWNRMRYFQLMNHQRLDSYWAIMQN